MDLHEAFLDGASYDRMAERAVQKFRHYCKYVNSHLRCFQKVVNDCKNSILMRVLLKKWYICDLYDFINL